MKILYTTFVIVLAVLACGCTTTAPQTAPSVIPDATRPVTDLTVIWTGPSAGHTEVDGFHQLGNPLFNSAEQQGLVFTGNKKYTRANGTVDYENISGIISSDGKVFMVNHESNIAYGEMMGPDTMELRFLDDGENAKAFLLIRNRQKS